MVYFSVFHSLDVCAHLGNLTLSLGLLRIYANIMLLLPSICTSAYVSFWVLYYRFHFYFYNAQGVVSYICLYVITFIPLGIIGDNSFSFHFLKFDQALNVFDNIGKVI